MYDPQQLLKMWLKEREIQQQSPHTLKAYARDLNDFLAFVSNNSLPYMM